MVTLEIEGDSMYVSKCWSREIQKAESDVVQARSPATCIRPDSFGTHGDERCVVRLKYSVQDDGECSHDTIGVIFSHLEWRIRNNDPLHLRKGPKLHPQR